MQPISDDPARSLEAAIKLQEDGTLAEAEAAYRAVLKDAPNHAEALLRLGHLLRTTRRAAEALPLIERAVAAEPHRSAWQNERAVALLALHRFDDAEEALCVAIADAPDNAEAHANLANLALMRGQFDAAAAAFRAACAAAPEIACFVDGLGKALFALGQIGEAVACWRRALALDPRFAPAWRNLGDAYRAEGAFEAARAAYAEALRVSPQDGATVRWREAMTLLAAGDFAEGWLAYRARPAANGADVPRLTIPVWADEPLGDKRILVWGEQGVGDEIMFASCLPNLAAAARHVVLVCEPRLAPLFARSFPTIEVLGTRREAVPCADLARRADLWVMAGDLPARFRREEAAFGDGAAYLAAHPDAVARWRDRYDTLGPGLKVGLSWRGGCGALVKARRAVPLGPLGRVLGGGSVHLINLQYGADQALRSSLEAAHGLAIHDWPDSDPLVDLDDFAAKIAALDLVISVDNTTVHLAGALGSETWALLPKPADWRWLTGRADTPWYGTVRLFRQARPGDWAPALHALDDALEARIAAAQVSAETSTAPQRMRLVQPTAPTALAPEPRRLALLNDTSDWYHWGCTCTSLALREGLTARGWTVDPISIRETYRCAETPPSIAAYKNPAFFTAFAAANRALIERIASAERVVVNGEGTLHGTAPVVRNLLYLAYAARRWLGKPVDIINHSCFPEAPGAPPHEPTRALYRMVYEAVDHIAVREPASQAVLRDLGIEPTLAFDCLPLYVAGHGITAPTTRHGVVLAGSVAWRQESMAALARFVAAMDTAGHPVTVLTGAAADPARDDTRFIDALRAEVDEEGDGWTLFDAPSAEAWLTTIAQARLLVSGRFHHTIAALTLDTPVVVLNSNTPKLDGLVAMTDQREPLPYDTPDLAMQLIARAEEVLAGGAAVLDDSAVTRLCALAEKNFAGLAMAESGERDAAETG